eukprot:9037344-Heterocapsa_arctica.AAC.1
MLEAHRWSTEPADLAGAAEGAQSYAYAIFRCHCEPDGLELLRTRVSSGHFTEGLASQRARQ